MAIQSGMTETANFWRDEIELQERLKIGDEFWFDVVTRLKREKRYMEAAVICRKEIPLPAAYRHLIICLRKLSAYRQGEDCRTLLTELYAYAVEFDVLYRVPYVEYQTPVGKRGCSGFNVASIVWTWLTQKPLMLSYDEMGYKQICTLNQTDRKRLVNEFGEPNSHRDPFVLLKPLWDKGIDEMARRQEQRDREFQAELRSLLNPPAKQSEKRGWLSRLLGRG
jgi:hypothetical protein